MVTDHANKKDLKAAEEGPVLEMMKKRITQFN